MRRAAGVVAGVLAVVLLLTGTGVTLAAWTSDEVTVEGETFTAGNLDVTLVPVDVPEEAVARPGEPYIAHYKATVTKTGDNLRELSCDVIAEGFRWVLDEHADAVSARVVIGGEQSGAVLSYSHVDGGFDDPGCTLSFGESDTLEIPVEFRVETDMEGCTDPAQTVGGGVALQVSQSRAGIDMPWSAQASVELPEVTLDEAREEALFDVTLVSYDTSNSANENTLRDALRALRPELTMLTALNLVRQAPVVVVPGVDAATAENAKAALEGAGVGAVVSVSSVGPSPWRSIRDEPSAGLSDVIFWSGTPKNPLVTAIRTLTGLSLSDATRLYDSAPVVLLSGVDNATAENAKAVIEAASGVVKFMPPGGAACW